MATSLRKQTISSVKWTTFKTILIASTFPALQIILARYLSPDEFAHIAIILIFTGLFETLENFGISQAVIQKESIDDKEASSLFFFNIFRGIWWVIILFFLSKPISSFFNLPDLNNYLKLTSLLIIIGSPAKLFRAIMQKHLMFKTLSLIELTRHMAMMIFVSLFLYKNFGVMGYIFGNLIASGLQTFLIVFFCIKNRMQKILPYFSFARIYPLLNFGTFVSGKQVMTYCAHRIDEVLIGYFLSSEVLGMYSFGKRTLEHMRRLITDSFSKVLFPVLSNLKDNPQKIGNAYLKVTKFVAFLSFPVFIGIAVTAHLFVPILFGEKWIDSIIVFQIFSIVMILIILTGSVAVSLLYSLNKPNIVFFADFFTGIFYFGLLFIFARQGIIYVLIIYPLYMILKFLVFQFYANKYLKSSFINYFFQLWKITLISAFMALSIFIFQGLSDEILTLTLQLISSVTIGIIFIVGLSYIFERNTLIEIKNLLF